MNTTEGAAKTMTNLSLICLTQEQQMMHGTSFEYVLQRYFYPAVALFGIFGNTLNLTVLLNKSMRNRANTILSMLAFADIIFLILLFPNILANYSAFTFNYTFRWIYFHSKVHLIALANWCSAIAIWCVILVCSDRLVGIRNPLYVRGGWGSGRMSILLLSVICVTGGLTAYQHAEYECVVRSYCLDTQLYSRCFPISNDGSWFANRTNPYPVSYRVFLKYSTLTYIFSMIIVPIVLLTILNVMLICALRQRHQQFAITASTAHSADPKRESVTFQKTEHRVTMTVTCIVTMFTVTNGPSALWHLLKTAYKLENDPMWYNITMLCSTLVICGKASNFIVFCLGSRHFRLRLIKLARMKVHKKMGCSVSSTALNGRRATVKTASSRGPSPKYSSSLIDRCTPTFPLPRIGSGDALRLPRKVTISDREDGESREGLVMGRKDEERRRASDGLVNDEKLHSNIETFKSRKTSGTTSTSPRLSLSTSLSAMRPRGRSSVGSGGVRFSLTGAPDPSLIAALNHANEHRRMSEASSTKTVPGIMNLL